MTMPGCWWLERLGVEACVKIRASGCTRLTSGLTLVMVGAWWNLMLSCPFAEGLSWSVGVFLTLFISVETTSVDSLLRLSVWRCMLEVSWAVCSE